MHFNRAVAAGLLLPALAVGVVACGDDDKSGGGGDTAVAKNLTVYGTLPLQGASSQQTTSIVNGAKLALKQRNGKIGDFTIAFKPLDDSLASTGSADEGKEAQNARTAVRDKSTIALLGAYNSGMTKVSLPITNKAGILQVSPANTYVGLTTDQPGSEKGEPDKYYPSRHADVRPRRAEGHDPGSRDGHGHEGRRLHVVHQLQLEDDVQRRPRPQPRHRGQEAGPDDPRRRGRRHQGAELPLAAGRRQGRTASRTSMEIENNGMQLLKDAATALPSAKLYAGDAMVLNDTADPKKGLPASVAARFKGTIATLDPKSFPAEGKKFFTDYSAEYNVPRPDPYAIYGYEAMDLILDSIEAVGDKGGDRQAVIDQVLENTKGRESVLGTYDIDENGDTTLTDYGLYRIEDGKLVFDKVVKAASA